MKPFFNSKLSYFLCLFGLLIFHQEISAQGKIFTKQLSLKHDNDVFRFRHVTDRYYSFGLIFNYNTVLKNEHFIKKSFEGFGFESKDKFIFDNMIYLKGFTPESDSLVVKGSYRPFAGVLNWEPSVYISNENRIWRFGATLGVRGKISGAEWVQDHFHDLIKDPKFDGWRYQLPNKFLFGLNGSYIKPISIVNWMDVFSESNLALGNYETYLEENIGLRVGKFNQLNNSTLFYSFLDREKRNKNEYYFVLKFFGRAVATNTTLAKDADKQDILNPIDKKNLQAGYQASIFVQIGRLGASFSHTRNSTESNVSGKHSYGSLAISYSFN